MTDQSSPSFAVRRHKCPERYNPAEFYADLIAYDFSTPDLEATSRQRVAQLHQAFVKWHGKDGDSTAGAAAENGKEEAEKPVIKRPKQAVGKQGSGWRTQFRLLLERSWRQVRATPGGANTVRYRAHMQGTARITR